MKTDWKIPVDKFGGVIHYVYPYKRGAIAKWLDRDTTWEMELQLKNCDQGRSSVWFNFENVRDTAQIFPFNVRMLMKMVMSSAIVNGRVLGKFGVKKHGLTYTMEYLSAGDWDAKM